jgi:hypothetical protein
MAAVTNLSSKRAPNSGFGENDLLGLKLCADWRIARYQQQINWTKYDLASTWGMSSTDASPDTDPLKRMKKIEGYLAEEAPNVMLHARELLNVCITILSHAYEDPDGRLADGPVLEILRNVVLSLDYCDGDMIIGKKLGKRNARGA